MIRLIGYILLMAVVTAAAVFLADRPGAVSVQWQDWRIDTSVPVLVLAAIVVVAIPLFIWRLLSWFFGTPKRLVIRQQQSRKHRGYQALAHGLAAAAAGQAKEARQLARRAEKMLADPSLTAVLSAQAAHLAGEAKEARIHFTQLLEHPKTAALGLRGLLHDAIAKQDAEAAVDLAHKARKHNPSDKGLAETLYGLLIRSGRIREAEALVDDAHKKKAMEPEMAARRRAVLAHERSQESAAAGNHRDALDHAIRAVKADPGFAVGAAVLATRRAAAGQARRAMRVLSDAWKKNPAPELIAAARHIAKDEVPLEHLRRLEKITAGNPDHPEAHKALGEAALAARLWGEARRHLLAALQSHPTQGVYRLLAKLEEAEFANRVAAHEWMEKAAHAAPDPGWACTVCGKHASEWTLTCPSCGAIDSLAWVSSHGAPVTADTGPMAQVGYDANQPPPNS
ncbi:MAG TPA: heme biosynthesis HemY N-terminal domain-containing protein [Magnetospirillaceae bacterium]